MKHLGNLFMEKYKHSLTKFGMKSEEQPIV